MIRMTRPSRKAPGAQTAQSPHGHLQAGGLHALGLGGLPELRCAPRTVAMLRALR